MLDKLRTCDISWNSSAIIVVTSLPCVDVFGLQQSSQPDKFLKRGTASRVYHNLDCKDSRFVQVFFIASLTHSERKFDFLSMNQCESWKLTGRGAFTETGVIEIHIPNGVEKLPGDAIPHNAWIVKSCSHRE